MTDIAIVAARRTPQGRFLGALKKHSAVQLACHAGAAVLDGIDHALIEQVILGNVLSAGQGMNVARQVGVHLGLPFNVPAFTVNMMCASGMQAVILAAQAIRAGDAQVVLCGGAESMSNAPYVLPRARTGYQLGDGTLIDTLLHDGLVDAFDQRHMGLTAETLAEKFGISRAAQDEFAARSQARWAAAHAQGRFAAEIIPFDELSDDEHPRPGVTPEQLAGLRPAFDSAGTVTPGNASGINDGAALLLVADSAVAAEHGWPVLAMIDDWVSVGCDPKEMGLGPVHATQRLCERIGRALTDFDHIELNEAFAAQALACLHELGPDEERVNPHGGAIAAGHPIGATGARLITHVAHQIAAGHCDRGLATLCVGGGMGTAVALRKP